MLLVFDEWAEHDDKVDVILPYHLPELADSLLRWRHRGDHRLFREVSDHATDVVCIDVGINIVLLNMSAFFFLRVLELRRRLALRQRTHRRPIHFTHLIRNRIIIVVGKCYGMRARRD